MQPFIASLYMTSAACFSMGLLAGVAWLRRRDLAHYGLFALMAIFAGLKVAMEPVFYQATTVPAYAHGLWWQILFIIFFLLAFAWFLPAYTRIARRGLAWIITAVLLVDLVIHLRLPYTLLYSEITSLGFAILPWGERIAVAEGIPTPFRPIVEAPGLLLAVMFVDAAIRMWREGSRRKVWVLSSAYVPFFVLFSLWGPLIDLGVVRAPYLGTFAFLVIVLVFGSDFADDVAKASALAAEVAAREKRWKALFQESHLAMARVAADGTVESVNPFLCRITGFQPGEVQRKHFTVLLPEEEQAIGRERFALLLRGEGASVVEGRLVTRDGGQLAVLWSRVVLRDVDGRVKAAIAVGSDITDRIEAQEARDRAIDELEGLKAQLEEENLYLRQEITTTHGFHEIIGESPALRYVLHRVEQVADAETTVVIQGETGVGKELVARAIHRRSGRAAGPFIRVNCAALPATLIESELFGHERGAFTGAVSTRKGRFEMADGGTLLLDEVSELPLELQGRLLRVLQEGEFERVGSSVTRKANVRLVASTNRNLADEVSVGRFREDLFYRLHVYPITVPPLRDRVEDIPALVAYFVRRLSEAAGRSISEVPQGVIRALEGYSWPGNVRELENVLERAVILSGGSVLELPEGFQAVGPVRERSEGSSPRSVGHATLAEVEREHIRAVLRSTEGKVGGQGGAAEILGLHPNTLRSRMKKLGVDPRAASAPPG